MPIFDDTEDSWDAFDDEEHGSFKDDIPDDGFLFGKEDNEESEWDDYDNEVAYWDEDL